MQRINSTNRAVNKFGAGKDGFQSGSPATGVKATYVTAEWANAVQEELARTVEGAGIELDATKYGQLLDAIKTIAWGAGLNTPPHHRGELGDVNLSTVFTVGALQQQNAALATKQNNYPFDEAGTLEIYPWGEGGEDVFQRYTSVLGDKFATRSVYSGMWTDWNIFDARTLKSQMLQVSDWEKFDGNGFFNANAGFKNEIPAYFDGDVNAIGASNGAGQMIIASPDKDRLFFKSTDDGNVWSRWIRLVGDGALEERLKNYRDDESLHRAVTSRNQVLVNTTVPYVLRASDYKRVIRADAAAVVVDCSAMEAGKTYTFVTSHQVESSMTLDFGDAGWIMPIDDSWQKSIKLPFATTIQIFCVSTGYYIITSVFRASYRSDFGDVFYEQTENGEYRYYRKVELAANTTYTLGLPNDLKGTANYRVSSIVVISAGDTAVTTPHVKNKTVNEIVVRNANSAAVTIEMWLDGLLPTVV